MTVIILLLIIGVLMGVLFLLTSSDLTIGEASNFVSEDKIDYLPVNSEEDKLT